MTFTKPQGLSFLREYIAVEANIPRRFTEHFKAATSLHLGLSVDLQQTPERSSNPVEFIDRYDRQAHKTNLSLGEFARALRIEIYASALIEKLDHQVDDLAVERVLNKQAEQLKVMSSHLIGGCFAHGTKLSVFVPLF